MNRIALALTFALAAGCADTSWSKTGALQMHIELTEQQLSSSYADDVKQGKVLDGAQFVNAILLRAGSPRAGALVATHGYSVRHSGEVVLHDTNDVQVRFVDGRAWISVGSKVPYVDGEGRLLLLDPSQLFGMPDTGGDLRKDRIPLERVLADEKSFTPGS